MTRKSTVLVVLLPLAVAACGPRSSGTGPDTTAVPDTVPVARSTSESDTASDTTPADSPTVTTTTAVATESDPSPESVEDGVQAVQPEVEIPDVDELDELLADVDAALAGIELDADEGALP